MQLYVRKTVLVNIIICPKLHREGKSLISDWFQCRSASQSGIDEAPSLVFALRTLSRSIYVSLRIACMYLVDIIHRSFRTELLFARPLDEV